MIDERERLETEGSTNRLTSQAPSFTSQNTFEEPVDQCGILWRST